MKCPIDGTQLVMTERSGVEIDYCPQCRGIWLDRGELDKILDRSSGGARSSDSAQRVRDPYPEQRDARSEYRPEQRRSEDTYRRHDSRSMDNDHHRREPRRYDDDYGYKGKRKTGVTDFLEDLFDF
ncbi:MAG: zf-TFIIB domain-containing protein [Pseudomonadota bacterium]